MSKPDDIPQDVWDAAFYHFDDFGLVGALYDEDEEHLVLRCISSAIRAAKAEEREACAVAVGNFLILKSALAVSKVVDAEEVIRKRGEAP